MHFDKQDCVENSARQIHISAKHKQLLSRFTLSDMIVRIYMKLILILRGDLHSSLNE